MTEPAASRTRWFLAILAALLLSLLIPSPGALLGSTWLGWLVPIVLAILVAGLIVGARSVRRWLTVAVVAGGVALAVVALSVLLIQI